MNFTFDVNVKYGARDCAKKNLMLKLENEYAAYLEWLYSQPASVIVENSEKTAIYGKIIRYMESENELDIVYNVIAKTDEPLRMIKDFIIEHEDVPMKDCIRAVYAMMFSTVETRHAIISTADRLLRSAVTDSYASDIMEYIRDDTIEDVMECSGIEAGEGFSETDVSYAIGRALLAMLSEYDTE